MFVYFDLGNILVSFDPKVACQNVSDLFQVPIERAQAVVYDSGLEVQYELGKLSDEEIFSAVKKELGVDAYDETTQSQFLQSIADMFQPIESMPGVIDQVRSTGHQVGILSNTCPAHWHWIRDRTWPVASIEFDQVILSYEVGAMKPDPAIYAAAEQAAGLDAGQIVFIDDREENVAAAQSRGWNAAQCFGGDDAIEQLTRLGVLN